MEEIWKDIEGYEGNYKVSNLGRIKSLPREWFSNGGRRHHDGLIMKPFKNPKGYLMIDLTKNGIGITIAVHRLVAIAFISNPENKPEVNHKKGVKTDNRASELEWNTEAENVQHAHRIGLKFATRGEKCGTSKLKNEDVVLIRKLYESGGYTLKELGRRYNVYYTAIQKIITRNSWNHI